MNYPGKPAEPKPNPRNKRAYLVELNGTLSAPNSSRLSIVHANYMRTDDGLVSFWQDNEPLDILEVAYPLRRIHSIVEQQ